MLVLNSGNKPLPSFPGPLYQNEVKCSAFDMEMIFHSHANITHFDKKGCALGLILKVRVFGTRKWPIRHFEVARETGSRWLSKCIVGLFWAANLPPCCNASSKTVPQCTLATISTQSPAQPQSGERRPNSRALGTAGSVMTSLLKNRCSHLENQFDVAKQDWLVQMFGLLFSSSFKNTTGGSVRRVTFPILVYFSIVYLTVLVVICHVGFRERSRCFGRWTADFSAYEWSWRSGRWFAARSNTHAGIELFLLCKYRQVVNRSLNFTA